MKDYHEAAKKQPYGEMEERWSCQYGKGHFVNLYSSEQKQVDTRAINLPARDFGHLDVSAYRLLI